MKKKLFMNLVLIMSVFTVDGFSQSNSNIKPMVTFVELGSVNCIPCKQMQPVLNAVEEKYGGQIEVVFYDVWKDDQKQYAEKYGIKLIPTQVFLDEKGKEFFRHEGFYPEKEIDKLLRQRGLKAIIKKAGNG